MKQVDRNGDALCLMQVHAHPDDEASKGAGTNARYATEGVRTVLVCCTGGEAGEVLNSALNTDEVRNNLAVVRRQELEASATILKYDAVHWLGYHDSGMPDTEVNERPDNFANAPLDEAVGRLVSLIRSERPQIMLAYDEDREWYPHPDHIQVHVISVAAFHAAGDPSQFPEAGEPWAPSKLYFSGFAPARILALHELFIANGLESPFVEWLDHIPATSPQFDTHIDIRDYLGFRRRALQAHATQVAPDSFWLQLPDELLADVFGNDEFVLAASLVDVERDSEGIERDLFSGVRAFPSL